MSDAGTSGPFAPDDLPGLAVLFAGAVLCAISFAVLPWYSVTGVADSAGEGFRFADLHANADQLAAPVAAAYFDRLAWGLVGIVVVLALAARALAVAGAVLRVTAFLVAVAGLVLTYYSLAQLFNAQRIAGGSAHSVVHSASYGLYLAFVGYLTMAAGAIMGYRSGASRTSVSSAL